MTRDASGKGRPSGLSRRRLLAGIGGVGAIGMASGVGTGAYLSDRETFSSNVFGAGEVELTVDGEPTGGTVSLGVSGIDRGESGRETFDVGVRTNPVRVWFATTCPDPDDALANALEVELVVDGESVTGDYRPLADVARDFVTGSRLVDGCLDSDGAVTVDVYWRLSGDASDAVAGESVDLTFRLYAEQCRHVSEADAAESNPFADRECEGPACVPCEDENGVKIGTLTLRYLGDEPPANVTVVATGGGAGGVGTGGTAVFAGEVAPGETFLVDGSASPTGDPDWIGPNIFVDDGFGADEGNGETENGNNGNGSGGNRPAGVNIHTSCSVSLAPGDIYGDFEVVSMTSTDGEPICGSDGSDDGGEDDEPDDDPEPDPECAVCENEETSLATLDVRYRGDDDAAITVVSTKGDTSGTLFKGTVVDGDVFTLRGSDVERPGKGTDRLGPEVEITVDDAATVPIHVSCSKPLAVGMAFGDDEFEIAGGTTTDRESLCGSEAN